jgi:hypothetical protein
MLIVDKVFKIFDFEILRLNTNFGRIHSYQIFNYLNLELMINYLN